MPSSTTAKKPTAKPAKPVVEMADGAVADLHSIDPTTEDSDADDLVLLLYEPTMAGAQDRGKYSEDTLMIPIQIGNNEMPTGFGRSIEVPVYEQKGIVPGLQRVKRSDAEAIMSSKSPGVVSMIERNILRVWSDTAELHEMDQSKAIDSIRKAKSTNLLKDWAKSYSKLPAAVQRELESREEEMKADGSISAGKKVFGESVG